MPGATTTCFGRPWPATKRGALLSCAIPASNFIHVVLRIVANSDDAADVVLEPFGKAFRSLPGFNPEFAFSTRLFRIGTTCCIDFVRHRRIRTQSIHVSVAGADSKGTPLDVPDHAPTPQEALMRAERSFLLRNGVAWMPPKYRALVERHDDDALPCWSGICALQIPPSTFLSSLTRKPRRKPFFPRFYWKRNCHLSIKNGL